MDVDGIQTPSKRLRTASGRATMSATIPSMMRVQMTRPELPIAHTISPRGWSAKSGWQRTRSPRPLRRFNGVLQTPEEVVGLMLAIERELLASPATRSTSSSSEQCSLNCVVSPPGQEQFSRLPPIPSPIFGSPRSERSSRWKLSELSSSVLAASRSRRSCPSCKLNVVG